MSHKNTHKFHETFFVEYILVVDVLKLWLSPPSTLLPLEDFSLWSTLACIIEAHQWLYLAFEALSTSHGDQRISCLCRHLLKAYTLFPLSARAYYVVFIWLRRPERDKLRLQHEEVITVLNQRMAEKATKQIELNETRDKLRGTNSKVGSSITYHGEV